MTCNVLHPISLWQETMMKASQPSSVRGDLLLSLHFRHHIFVVTTRASLPYQKSVESTRLYSLSLSLAGWLVCWLVDIDMSRRVWVKTMGKNVRAICPCLLLRVNAPSMLSFDPLCATLHLVIVGPRN